MWERWTGKIGELIDGVSNALKTGVKASTAEEQKKKSTAFVYNK